MSGTSQRAAEVGFTLVELLVVVAIVAALLAIAMPVVNRVRATAKSVVCTSNLRQVGLALNVYLEDSDGRMPTLANRESVNDPQPAIDTALFDGGESKVLACPADDRGLFDRTGTSYFWNTTVNGQHINKLFSIAGGSDPRRIPLVLDKEGFHPNLRDKVNTLYADGHVDKQLTFVDETGKPIEAEEY